MLVVSIMLVQIVRKDRRNGAYSDQKAFGIKMRKGNQQSNPSSM